MRGAPGSRATRHRALPRTATLGTPALGKLAGPRRHGFTLWRCRLPPASLPCPASLAAVIVLTAKPVSKEAVMGTRPPCGMKVAYARGAPRAGQRRARVAPRVRRKHHVRVSGTPRCCLEHAEHIREQDGSSRARRMARGEDQRLAARIGAAARAKCGVKEAGQRSGARRAHRHTVRARPTISTERGCAAWRTSTQKMAADELRPPMSSCIVKPIMGCSACTGMEE